jgi:SAM-dependent methyltransferase
MTRAENMTEFGLGIDHRYELFYSKKESKKLYPTEFIVRIFLASYPRLAFLKPAVGDRVLDVAFGDGRNTAFLLEQGYEVSGIEITSGIVNQAKERLAVYGYHPDLRVGRNSAIPFQDEYFDCIVASHCCYYCDDGELFADNLSEYARVMKPGASLIASIANKQSYIFNNALCLDDGTFRIQSDPYGNRNGYRLAAFSRPGEIEAYLSRFFCNFSFGVANNDFFGIDERVFWVVCKKIKQ